MNLDIVKQYFKLMEDFCITEKDFESILHPEIEQIEFPNWLTDHVIVSDWNTLFKRMPAGKALLKEQKYDIQNVIEADNTLITEVIWEAKVGADIGNFKRGQQLKAYFCCIFEFKDGKIFRQRNYDCFERF